MDAKPLTKDSILGSLKWEHELDLLIVGFWGHGVVVNNERYLCPIVADPKRINETAVALSDVLETVGKIPAKNVCIILDCCQSRIEEGRSVEESPTFEEGELRRIETLAERIFSRDIEWNLWESSTSTPHKIGQTVAILNACSDMEKAYEWDEKGHGFFTAHLLTALRDRKTSLHEIYQFVHNETIKSAQKKHVRQTPSWIFKGAAPDIILPAILEAQRQRRKRTIVMCGIVGAIVLMMGMVFLSMNAARLEREAEMWQVAETSPGASPETIEADVSPPAPVEIPAVNVSTPAPSAAEGRTAGERLVKTINGVEYAFRWCPAGSFLMGSPSWELGRKNSEEQHRVTLSQGFWMLETEVTQAMWESVAGSNPSRFKGASLPVECVSWNECVEFCEILSQVSGLKIALPTEAQWEYACRAGTTTSLNNGKNITGDNLNEVGWYRENSDSTTHTVGQKKPNAWGLYDMHGNVCEWCSDWHRSHYRAVSPECDPTGARSAAYRVFRGGSWDRYGCRSAFWTHATRTARDSDLGFRLVLVP
ncbi:MAG: formylglycine-generating enzyme family protein, partial [Planctomycetia bacterium]|nr:formylglycine-generating enzyme family protein [Planctomycetia bacterium]